ncbi:hypothetical protein E3N88_23137 [Mikania micrantha]|uniref:Uncharacterized protein n=1 Tax=Mikania micrantha TaxID=192012 RepID=A0A5N6NCE8_9ASTR|nr:hypothetical protein E3N88_23137 [Mikania micrantha]
MFVKDDTGTTMGSRTMEEKKMVENKLQKPVIMTLLKSLEERVDVNIFNSFFLTIKILDHFHSDLCGSFCLHIGYSVLWSGKFVAKEHQVCGAGDAGDVSSQCDIICVQGYKVKKSVAPTLESIFKKHGDIAAECVFKPASMRSSFLQIVCEVESQIQTTDYLEEMEEIEQQLLATGAANINIDLRDRGLALVAAQQRFEEAERCVRVLHLVEKNLTDNILDSKANIDSWGSEQVL